MIFSSYKFIFLFLPAAVLGYVFAKRYWGVLGARVWLICASLVFYAQGNIRLLPILLLTVFFNHAIIHGIGRFEGKRHIQTALYVLSLLENLGLLFYFKYLNFFFENVNRFFGKEIPMLEIMLPIGISFYTFTIISCVTDVYKSRVKPMSLLEFTSFATFFPQLVVGPITRYDKIAEQINDDGFLKLNPDNIMTAVFLFSMGCGKKVLLADPLISHAQGFYDASAGGDFFGAWSGVLAYTFAYYFDFSGYIDMALGLGRIFNIKLPENFNSPYKARNFPDFWRRWNITVSQFFNEQIFKNIFKFGDGVIKLVFATLMTFAVSGIWHGAGWHFIAWGAVNGILVSAGNIMTLKRKSLPSWLAYGLTFFFILLTRVLFDSSGMTQALSVYRLMFDIRPFFHKSDGLAGLGIDFMAFISHGIYFVKDNIYIIVLMALSAFICFAMPNTGEIVKHGKLSRKYAVLSGIVLAASLFYMGAVSSFLYFQF